MELKFREYYQDQYQDNRPQIGNTGWKMPGPIGAAAGGAYLGYALGGPLGAVAGGALGYGASKFLGPQHGGQHADPRAFTYYRDESGKVQRYLPGAPPVDDERSPEEYEALNADPSHPYIYWQAQDGKWHSAKKGAQRYGYGQKNYTAPKYNQPKPR